MINFLIYYLKIIFTLLLQTKKRFSRLINNNIKQKEKKLIILYTSGIIIYCISLAHLSGIEMRCFFWNGEKCYYAIGILILISSFIISITIYIILYNNYQKKHLIILCIIYLILLIIDHNAEIIKHGLFNFILFIIITFILFIFIVYFHF